MEITLGQQYNVGEKHTVILYTYIKGAVYTVWIFISSCMFLELFLFAKNMKFLTKGGIHCISRSTLGAFILCAGTHWSN